MLSEVVKKMWHRCEVSDNTLDLPFSCPLGISTGGLRKRRLANSKTLVRSPLDFTLVAVA